MTNFANAPFQLKYADAERAKIKNTLPFGVPYLDAITGGILTDDLVIMTARTGSGKSELATLLAQAVLSQGKRVTLFALEAYKGEIESRLKFKMLAQAFYSQRDYRSYKRIPNYHDWRRKINSDLVDKFEPEVNEVFNETFKNLFTCYRENNFTPSDFEREIGHVWSFTDLVILDHLHYFDFDYDNENAAMKSTVKRIREISQMIKKPVVLVAHLRKKDRGMRSLVPDVEEVHGSSDIVKVATMVISASPAFDQNQENPYLFPTYLRLCKNRDDSSRTRYVGLCGFNIRDNTYEENFKLGKLSMDESEFHDIEGEWPQWARRQ